MSGAHAMRMAWAPGPWATWLAAAAAFELGWMVMMTAMMLPSLVPMLRRYRKAIRRGGEERTGTLTATVAAGYFAVWGALGWLVYAVGAALSSAAMHWSSVARVAPIASAIVIVVAAALQFTAWKSRQLACCRGAAERRFVRRAGSGTAWRYGLHLGARCVASCAGLTTILLVVGLMDLRAMAAVTAAITAERLAPAGERVARFVGVVGVCVGIVLVARAVSPR